MSANSVIEITFGELFDFSNGVNADKSLYGAGIPFINVSEIISNNGIREADIPGRITLPKDVALRYEVKYGDVLFNRSSETQEEVGLSTTYLGSSSVVFGGFVLRGRPRTDLLDVAYSKYALRAKEVRDQIIARGQGGIRANVGQRDLSSVVLRLPDLSTQRRVAEQLDDLAESVRAAKRLIEKKRAIKLGVTQELLTGRSRLPSFSGEWKLTNLCELGAFLKGRGVKRDDVRSAGVPCIRYGELYTSFSDYTASTRSFVSRFVAATAQPIQFGDILFAGSGETKADIGKSVAYVGDESAVAGGDIVILRGSGFDPVFLSTLLNTASVATQKARVGQGDAVVHISAASLGAIELRVPELPEQQALGKLIRDFDNEMETLMRRLAVALAVQEGTSQELLSVCAPEGVTI